MSEDKVAVYIPRKLYERIKREIESTGGFESVDEYVTFVLEELLSGEEHGEEAYSKEEEELIKERLRSLGYL